MKFYISRSESIINNLLVEVESLTYRIKNIKQTYLMTYNKGLRERLIKENKTLLERLNEISSIATLIKKREPEQISLSSLLVEKCKRTNNEINLSGNLFFH